VCTQAAMRTLKGITNEQVGMGMGMGKTLPPPPSHPKIGPTDLMLIVHQEGGEFELGPINIE